MESKLPRNTTKIKVNPHFHRYLLSNCNICIRYHYLRILTLAFPDSCEIISEEQFSWIHSCSVNHGKKTPTNLMYNKPEFIQAPGEY